MGRAWPHDRRGPEGEELITVEGRDDRGRLRAGRLHLRRTEDLGWSSPSAHLTAPGRDRRLPDLAAAVSTGTLLVHRYGKRAVVRRADDVIKVVRPGRAAEIADLARRGHRLARESGFSAPAVLRQERATVSFGVLPGRSLHDLGGHAPLEIWSGWWAAWAAAWPRLARPAGSILAAAGLPEHSPADEAGVLRRWVDLAIRFDALPAEQGAALRAAAAETAAELVTGPAQAAVISHRDLHDKQILAEGDALGLLDFDTAALAEPALDLANLWVHAELRIDQGLWSARHGAVVRAAVQETADALGVDEGRFRVHARATRLRLAALYAFRPRYLRVAIAWAGAAGHR